jgi:hypothetical protein
MGGMMSDQRHFTSVVSARTAVAPPHRLALETPR